MSFASIEAELISTFIKGLEIKSDGNLVDYTVSDVKKFILKNIPPRELVNFILPTDAIRLEIYTRGTVAYILNAMKNGKQSLTYEQFVYGLGVLYDYRYYLHMFLDKYFYIRNRASLKCCLSVKYDEFDKRILDDIIGALISKPIGPLYGGNVLEEKVETIRNLLRSFDIGVKPTPLIREYILGNAKK